AADENRALAHPTEAAGAVPGDGVADAAPVVDDAQDDTACTRLERHLDPRRMRVTCDVRQALLGDAVDGQLRLLRERGQLVCEAPLDPQPALVAELARELGQRADEAELVEHLRPQLAADPPDLLERLPDRRLGLLAPRLAFELEQDARQHLSDLVVEAARDPRALGLLRAQHAPRALAALRLEPAEHVVEDGDELPHLGPPLLGEPLPRPQQV